MQPSYSLQESTPRTTKHNYLHNTLTAHQLSQSTTQHSSLQQSYSTQNGCSDQQTHLPTYGGQLLQSQSSLEQPSSHQSSLKPSGQVPDPSKDSSFASSHVWSHQILDDNCTINLNSNHQSTAISSHFLPPHQYHTVNPQPSHHHASQSPPNPAQNTYGPPSCHQFINDCYAHPKNPQYSDLSAFSNPSIDPLIATNFSHSSQNDRNASILILSIIQLEQSGEIGLAIYQNNTICYGEVDSIPNLAALNLHPAIIITPTKHNDAFYQALFNVYCTSSPQYTPDSSNSDGTSPSQSDYSLNIARDNEETQQFQFPPPPIVMMKKGEFDYNTCVSKFQVLNLNYPIFPSSQSRTTVEPTTHIISPNCILQWISIIDFTQISAVMALSGLCTYLLENITLLIPLQHTATYYVDQTITVAPLLTNLMYCDGPTSELLSVFVEEHSGSSNRHHTKQGFSVFAILGQCKSSMGRYMLKKWLKFPSRDIYLLNDRLNHVEFFANVQNQQICFNIRKLLVDLKDVRPSFNKIGNMVGQPNDLIKIYKTCQAFVSIASVLLQALPQYHHVIAMFSNGSGRKNCDDSSRPVLNSNFSDVSSFSSKSTLSISHEELYRQYNIPRLFFQICHLYNPNVIEMHSTLQRIFDIEQTLAQKRFIPFPQASAELSQLHHRLEQLGPFLSQVLAVDLNEDVIPSLPQCEFKYVYIPFRGFYLSCIMDENNHNDINGDKIDQNYSQSQGNRNNYQQLNTQSVATDLSFTGTIARNVYDAPNHPVTNEFSSHNCGNGVFNTMQVDQNGFYILPRSNHQQQPPNNAHHDSTYHFHPSLLTTNNSNSNVSNTIGIYSSHNIYNLSSPSESNPDTSLSPQTPIPSQIAPLVDQYGFQYEFSICSTEFLFSTPRTADLIDEIGDLYATLCEYHHSLFTELCEYFYVNSHIVLEMAQLLCELDVFCSLGLLSLELGLTRPKLVEKNTFEVVDAKHLLLEVLLSDKCPSNYPNSFNANKSAGAYLGVQCIPNSLSFSHTSGSIHVVTGANQSGKSTLLRTMGLISFLAQVGCFVPAARAVLSPCDRIVYRCHTPDSVTNSLSTFAFDLSSLAFLLNNATEHSLLLLDEICVGTTLRDGVCLFASIITHFGTRNDQNNRHNCPKIIMTTHFQLEFISQLLKNSLYNGINCPVRFHTMIATTLKQYYRTLQQQKMFTINFNDQPRQSGLYIPSNTKKDQNFDCYPSSSLESSTLFNLGVGAMRSNPQSMSQNNANKLRAIISNACQTPKNPSTFALFSNHNKAFPEISTPRMSTPHSLPSNTKNRNHSHNVLKAQNCSNESNVTINPLNQTIVYLYKMVDISNHDNIFNDGDNCHQHHYGLITAQHAGVPKYIISRAMELLEHFSPLQNNLLKNSKNQQTFQYRNPHSILTDPRNIVPINLTYIYYYSGEKLFYQHLLQYHIDSHRFFVEAIRKLLRALCKQSAQTITCSSSLPSELPNNCIPATSASCFSTTATSILSNITSNTLLIPKPTYIMQQELTDALPIFNCFFHLILILSNHHQTLLIDRLSAHSADSHDSDNIIALLDNLIRMVYRKYYQP